MASSAEVRHIMAAVPKTMIGDTLEITRIVTGLWQVSGGHGRIDAGDAVRHMAALHHAGFTSFGITDPRPKTYAEFIAILERIQAADSDVVPLFMSDRDNWTTQIFMTVGYSFALGDRAEEVYGAIMDNELKFQDVPEFEGILNDYLTLIERELVNPNHLSATYDDAIAAVASGRAAMIYNGEWTISSLEAEGASIGAFPIPWTDKDLLSTGAYATGYFVPSAGDNVELALEVLNAIAQPEYLGIFFAENPAFPGLAGIDGGDLNTDVKTMVESYLAERGRRFIR